MNTVFFVPMVIIKYDHGAFPGEPPDQLTV